MKKTNGYQFLDSKKKARQAAQVACKLMGKGWKIKEIRQNVHARDIKGTANLNRYGFTIVSKDGKVRIMRQDYLLVKLCYCHASVDYGDNGRTISSYSTDNVMGAYRSLLKELEEMTALTKEALLLTIGALS